MSNLGNIPDEKRCEANGKDHKRCQNRKMVGLRVCRMHGGSTRLARRKSERAKAMTAMQRFVTPIDASDPEADFIGGFEMEWRRTVGRIRYYDEKLSELAEKELIWGMTKVEDKTATEFEGSDTTYEAKVNMYHELQWQERQHLLKMSKVYIGARLDEKKLQLESAKVMALDKAINGILAALGHDPKNVEVRQVVRNNLLALMPSSE